MINENEETERNPDFSELSEEEQAELIKGDEKANAQQEKITFLASIGSRVKKSRQKMGLTQDEFAKKYGYSRAALSKLEAGFRDFKASELLSLAKHLNVTTDYLLGRTRIASPDENLLNLYEEYGLTEESLAYFKAAWNDTCRLERDWNDNYVPHKELGLDAINVLLTSNDGQHLLESIGILFRNPGDKFVTDVELWIIRNLVDVLKKIRKDKFEDFLKEI